MHRAASALLAGMVLTSLAGCRLIEVLQPGGAEEPLREGTCATFEVAGMDAGQVTPEMLEQARTIIENRINATGVAETSVYVDAGSLRVDVLGFGPESDVSQHLRSLATAPGVVEFTPVPTACAAEVVADAPQPACLDEVEPLFDGSEVAAASMRQDEATGETVVDLELQPTGSRLFDEYAEGVFSLSDPDDRLFAIVLDGIVASAPSINAPSFGGQAQISGDFTVDEATQLVTVLRFGSLPLEVREAGFSDCGTQDTP